MTGQYALNSAILKHSEILNNLLRIFFSISSPDLFFLYFLIGDLFNFYLSFRKTFKLLVALRIR